MTNTKANCESVTNNPNGQETKMKLGEYFINYFDGIRTRTWSFNVTRKYVWITYSDWSAHACPLDRAREIYKRIKDMDKLAINIDLEQEDRDYTEAKVCESALCVLPEMPLVEKYQMTEKSAKTEADKLLYKFRDDPEAVDFIEKNKELWEEKEEPRPIVTSRKGHLRNGKYIEGHFVTIGFVEPEELMAGPTWAKQAGWKLWPKMANNVSLYTKWSDALMDGAEPNGGLFFASVKEAREKGKLVGWEEGKLWKLFKKAKKRADAKQVPHMEESPPIDVYDDDCVF